MGRAIILGGTGVIGLAVARHLVGAGWDVEVAARDASRVPADLLAAGASFTAFERRDGAGVAAVLSPGADLLVDCLAFTRADACLVLPHLGGVGSTVMLSSKAVYVDAEGRHVNSSQAPRFAAAIREDNPVMTPRHIDHRSAEGYGSNKVAAEQAYLESGHPVSVIRASKVHGVGALPAREWHVVRRVLDRRGAVLLRVPHAVNHTSAAVNIAALVQVVAEVPGARILNSADPDAPSVVEIVRTIAARLGHEWQEVVQDRAADDRLGRTPWDAAAPIVLDLSAALELGYRPVGDYASTIGPTVDWLVDEARRQGIAPMQPTDFFENDFDYGAEDRFLAARRH
ncbi:reductase [Arthrobacter echini]|uniref:Reductase n=1 Tax=Arthrobacter echini TaxID=1529066 RepID=A0A5D0XTV9_9MICC|nr:reductase [Arthrobacter echini]TYD00099.1 reductase [Arthrobacter echini]